MTTKDDIGSALAAAARVMHDQRSLEETLQAIAEAARNSIPGFDQVGISTIDKHGNAQTRAATGTVVHTLDKVQYSLGEGPCVDTLRDAEIRCPQPPPRTTVAPLHPHRARRGAPLTARS